MTIHKGLKERFCTFSLAEQLLMFGSEVQRIETLRARGDAQAADNAVERGFELLFWILNDPRWQGSARRELARLHEVFADALTGGKEYHSNLKDISSYLIPFAALRRR